MSRTLLCAVLFASVTAEAGRKAPAAELLVGVLSAQAVRECRARFEERWVQPHHEVGFVWLRPRPKVGLKSYRGKLVVVEGKPAARPPVKARSTGQCPAMQMRSDWVAGVNGLRIQRRGHPALAAFSVERIRAFVGLTVKRSSGAVVARFRNTLGRELKQVTLRMHYEGCYGKPGTTQKDRQFATIAAGATVKARFPLTDEDKRRRRDRRLHRASSLQLLSRTPTVHFAVDWPLARAQPAVIVRCPR